MLPLFPVLELTASGSPPRAFPVPLLERIVREGANGGFAEVTLRADGEGMEVAARAVALLEEARLPFAVSMGGRGNGGLAELLGRAAGARGVELVVANGTAEELPAGRGLLAWGLPVAVTLPFQGDLLADLERRVEALAEWGAAEIRFERGSPDADGVEGEAYRELGARIATLHQEGWPVRVSGCFPYCHTPLLFSSCGGGVHACVIRPDGGCYPCRFARRPFGNVSERSLAAIWDSPPAERWQGAQAEPCRECPLFVSCRSGCRGLLDDGIPDPLIKGFKARLLPPPVTAPLRLDETLGVRLRARRVRRDGRDLLVLGRRVLPVEPGREALLEAADGGALSLKGAAASRPDGALPWLFSLYLEGFVEFRPGSGGG